MLRLQPRPAMACLPMRSHTRCGMHCRRITLPLDGSSTEVKVDSLMRDDASYTFAELPRVNPKVKVRHRSQFCLRSGGSFICQDMRWISFAART